MKIRNGFVSNSSSSSFCIYGASFEMGELIEKVKTLGLITEDKIEEYEDDQYELMEILDEKLDLNMEFDYENEYVWIGRPWSSIGDDETGRQFKDDVEAKIEKNFGSGNDCETHDEVIYG